mmetsp:Transcript_6584/g.14277  ORF Transcript_6584/g.14277 Transcript_6584/m.14277 type:complete len:315 (-) Transcript_6584:232-1176(-)
MKQINNKKVATCIAISIAVPMATCFSIVEVHTHVAPLLHTSTGSLVRDSTSQLISSAPALAFDPQHAASGLVQKYLTTLNNNPLPTKMMTGAALATAGDAIAQSREDDDYNAARGASFASFDMTYRAAQHFLFPIIVDICRGQYLMGALAAFGASRLLNLEPLAAMERSLASQLIIVPFMYYPVFFTFTGFMQGLTFDEGVERAKENFLPLMKRNLLFWIPVQYVQFCYIPTDLQIPFLSCAGLAWTFILSLLAGSAKKYSTETPDHETYCVTGLEECCVIHDDELFPDIFDNDCDVNNINRTAKEEEREFVEN